MNHQQTNTPADEMTDDVYCSGETFVYTPGAMALKASVGGSAGSVQTVTQDAGSGGTEVVGGWEIADLGDGAAGEWSVPVKRDTGNANLYLKRIDICHVRGGVSIGSIGAYTSAFGVSFAFAGTSTFPVAGSAITPVAGDKVVVTMTLQNDSEGPETIDIVSDRVIVSPFTAVAASDSGAIMRRRRG